MLDCRARVRVGLRYTVLGCRKCTYGDARPVAWGVLAEMNLWRAVCRGFTVGAVRFVFS